MTILSRITPSGVDWSPPGVEKASYVNGIYAAGQAQTGPGQPIGEPFVMGRPMGFFAPPGLDPDAERTPAEAATLERLVQGGFRSESLLDDALLIALVETGVPIWALDEAHVEGTLGIRLAGADERLGAAEDAPPVPPGRLVVADDRGPLAVLFGELAPGHGVTPDTQAMRLFSVQVDGVPSIHVEEALWQCADILQTP